MIGSIASAVEKWWVERKRGKKRSQQIKRHSSCPLTVEELEPRCLLTGNAANPWTALGPAPQTYPGVNTAGVQPGETTSGRVSSLAYGFFNGNPVLYLGAAGGGLWRSSALNAGGNLSWTPLTDTQGLQNAITGLGAGASDVGSVAVFGPNVYDGTGEANYSADSRYGTGILESANGGNAWALIPGATNANEFFGNSISKIIAIPGPGEVYAAVVPPNGVVPWDQARGQWAPSPNWGVYQSLNNGQTWAKISGQAVGLPDSVITDLDYLTINGQTVLLATVGSIDGSGAANGIYEGVPQGRGGYQWTLLRNLPNGNAWGRMALASDHNSTFYVAVGNSAAPNTLGVVDKVVYNPANNTFTPTNITPTGVSDQNLNYNLTLGLSPTGRLYLGLQNSVLESNTTMTSWRNIVDPPIFSVTPHVDHHAFAFAPDGTVYEGDDGGVWEYDPAPFDAPAVYSVGASPAAITTTDVNPDGQLDLITADKTGNDVGVLLGSQTGVFGTATLNSVNPNGANPISIATGDFNSDGKQDIAVANSSTSNFSVLLNKGDGSGTFPPSGNPPQYPAYNVPLPAGIATADFNKDGPLDMAVATLALPGFFAGGFQVFPGNAQAGFPTKGDGTFGQSAIYSNVNLFPVAIAAAPLGTDTFPDIVILNSSSDGTVHNVAVFINKGDGTFPQNPSATYNVGLSPSALTIADVNADGIPDIITADTGANTVSVLLGKNDGTFQAAISSPAGISPVAVAFADFNNDGNPDLVVANKTTNSVTVLYGNRTGAFQSPAIYPSGGTSPSSVTTGDFNHDGIWDIAVANSGSNTVGVLLSNNKVPVKNLGGSWKDLNTPSLGITQLYSAGQQPGNRNFVVAASQDNGIALTANALANPNSWTTQISGDGVFARFDPNYNGTTNQVAYSSNQYGKFTRSDNGGLTWNVKVNGLNANANLMGTAQSGFPFKTIVAVDPVANAQRLLMGSNSQVFETNNRGDTWAAISPGGAGALDTSGVTALAYAPSNDNTIYVGFSDGQIFATQNDGANWTLVTNGQNNGAVWGKQPVTAIAVDPNNNAKIYVSIGAFNVAQVWTTGNAFANPPVLAPLIANLPNVPVNALVLDAGGNNLFAGTDVGVYQSPTAAANWNRFGTGLPWVQVDDLQLQNFPGVGTFLAAATHGRGVWVVDPPGSTNNSNAGSGSFWPPSLSAILSAAPTTNSALSLLQAMRLSFPMDNSTLDRVFGDPSLMEGSASSFPPLDVILANQFAPWSDKLNHFEVPAPLVSRFAEPHPTVPLFGLWPSSREGGHRGEFLKVRGGASPPSPLNWGAD